MGIEAHVLPAAAEGAKGVAISAAIEAEIATLPADERDDLGDKLSQLRRQMDRQLQELNAVYTIGKTVTAMLDLEQVLAVNAWAREFAGNLIFH